ncbi:MAG: hypothetical protein KGL39_21025 [Patescibacteria group bacterium]|nr:hypothetical protein [Patescibacteria group bacterium]
MSSELSFSDRVEMRITDLQLEEEREDPFCRVTDRDELREYAINLVEYEDEEREREAKEYAQAVAESEARKKAREAREVAEARQAADAAAETVPVAIQAAKEAKRVLREARRVLAEKKTAAAKSVRIRGGAEWDAEGVWGAPRTWVRTNKIRNLAARAVRAAAKAVDDAAARHAKLSAAATLAVGVARVTRVAAEKAKERATS